MKFPSYKISIIKLSYASAISVFLFVLILIFSVIKINSYNKSYTKLNNNILKANELVYDLNILSHNFTNISANFLLFKEDRVLNYYYELTSSFQKNYAFHWDNYYVNYFLIEHQMPYTRLLPKKMKDEIELVELPSALLSLYFDAYYLLKEQINAENNIILFEQESILDSIVDKAVTFRFSIDSLKIDTMVLNDSVYYDTTYIQQTIIQNHFFNALESGALAELFEPKLKEQKFKLYDKLFEIKLKLDSYYLSKSEEFESKIKTYTFLFIAFFIILVIWILMFMFIGTRHIREGITITLNYLKSLKNNKEFNFKENSVVKEISAIQQYIVEINAQQNDLLEFVKNIGQSKLNFEYKGKNDRFSQALLLMQDNLQNLLKETEIRKTQEQKVNWVNESLAEFNEILRKSDVGGEKNLYMEVLKQLIHSLNANQGGLFVIKEDHQGQYLELGASYAYNIERQTAKIIKAGTGVLGNVIHEKNPVYINNIPENYLLITSGIGETTPKYLYIQPLLLGSRIEGAIELASFYPFEEHHQTYLKRIAENLASVLSTHRNQLEMKNLLERSKMQHETLATQEEELRQNLEELSATQEEISRKESQMKMLDMAINNGAMRLEIDTRGRIIYANPLFLKTFSISFIDITDSELSSYLSRELEEMMAIKWRNLLKLKTGFSLEGYFRHQKERHYLIATVQPVFNQENKISKILFLALKPESKSE